MRKIGFVAVAAIALLLMSVRLTHAANPLDAQLKERVVEAGTVIGDFTRDYAGASKKYSISTFQLRGRVIAADVGKGPSGHTNVRVLLGSSTLDNDSEVPLWVDFNEKLADDVAKLKKGDLVQIEVAYSPQPAPAVIHDFNGFIGTKITSAEADPEVPTLRQDLVDWMRKHNSLHPGPNGTDNAMVAKMTERIDRSLGAGNDFSITFGPGLMKSKKPMAMCVQDGKMLLVELTADQFSAMKLENMSTTVRDVPSQDVREPAQLQMDQPIIAGGGTWDMTQPLKGTVKIKSVGRFAKEDANFSMRMLCYTANTRIEFLNPLHGPPAVGTLAMEFPPTDETRDQLRTAKPPGPRVVFFELVRDTAPDNGQPRVEVISQPAAMVLNITPK